MPCQQMVQMGRSMSLAEQLSCLHSGHGKYSEQGAGQPAAQMAKRHVSNVNLAKGSLTSSTCDMQPFPNSQSALSATHSGEERDLKRRQKGPHCNAGEDGHSVDAVAWSSSAPLSPCCITFSEGHDAKPQPSPRWPLLLRPAEGRMQHGIGFPFGSPRMPCLRAALLTWPGAAWSASRSWQAR